MTDTIVLASNNAGKLKEFNALFAERHIHILPQSQFVQEECAEPYGTFVENALAKARFAAKHSGLPALAHDDRYCYYVCVLVLVRHESDPQPVIAEGIWPGQWQMQPAGEHGFGYDPHFYLPEHGCTAAELQPEQKNRISHRAQALQALWQKMQAVGLAA